MTKDTAFPFFFNWRKPFAILSGDECKALLLAMLDYAEHGTEPPAFDGCAEMAAAFVFPALDKSRELREAKRRAGKNGNAVRWGIDSSESQAVADDRSASRKEKERKEEKSEENPPASPPEGAAREADEGFERFWAVYPRKAAKKDARAAWDKLAPDRATVDAMLAAIEAKRLSGDWQREGGRFIPLPATWLRGERWNDAPEADAPPAADAGSFDTDDFFRAALRQSYGDLGLP